MLAPCSPQALASSSSHANRDAVTPARGLYGWRLAPRKPLLLRRTAPTMRLEKRRAAFHVGALHPASPCFSVGPRQQCALKSGARPFLLAPCTLQALAPSSGHANRGAVIPVRGLSCWRLAPASPCSFVGPRQQRRRYPSARSSLLAPCSPQALAPSSGYANIGAVSPARGLSCWRLAPRKPLLLRRTTPT